MFGRRFKKGFISTVIKWKKPFSKVKNQRKKKMFFINNNFITKLYSNLSFLRFKTRKYYLKKLNLNFLYLNFRDIKNLNLNKNMYKIITPFKFLFKKYTISIFICQNYGKLTDYHLNMILSTLRKFISKRAMMLLNIKPYKLMFKRSAQVRMGGGKIAKLLKIYYPVFPGCIFLTLYGITYKTSLFCLKLLNSKLPIKVILKFINFI